MKKIRQTLKAHILETVWRILLKFGIGGALGELAHKNSFVFVWGVLSYRGVKMAFSLLL